MRKIGLTGAIGSGKSTVCRVFSMLGVPVYDADSASKRLLLEDPSIRKDLRSIFGEDAFTDDLPDTVKLAGIVFNDEAALKKLNGLMHPAVAVDFENWTRRHLQAAYVIKEAAILFESGADHGLDHTIAVTAPEPLRRSRTLHRYTHNPEQFERRQAQQWPESEKAARADFILCNDETQLLIPQVLELHIRFSS